MDFDIDAARKAGYSDQEIADHLSQVANFDAGKARQSGYSDQEIIQHLSQPQVAVANPPVAPTEPQAPSMTDQLTRQLGLTARDLVEGPAKLVGTVTDPFGRFAAQLMGQPYKPLAGYASEAATAAGLPQPKPGLETGVNLVAQGLVGGAGAGAAVRGVGALTNTPELVNAGNQLIQGGQGFKNLIASNATLGAQQALTEANAANATPSQQIAETGAGILGGELGGTIGAGIPAVAGRIVQPVVSALGPEATRLAQLAESKFGIPLTAAQKTGSDFLNTFNSWLRESPIAGKQEEAALEAQKASFNRAVLQKIGVDAESATPEVMGKAKQAIGNVFNDVASRNAIQMDPQLAQSISDIHQNASKEMLDAPFKVLTNTLQEISDKATDGSLSGKLYQNIKSRLDRLSNNPDPSLGEYARQVRTALDDGLQRSVDASGNAEDYNALLQARQQWGAMRTIQGTINQQGDISGPKLWQALRTKAGGSQAIYGAGDQDLVDLAKIGSQFVGDKVANSKTAARGALTLAAMTAGGALGSEEGGNHPGLGALIGAGLAPSVARFALRNPAVESYLVNGIPAARRAFGAIPPNNLAQLVGVPAGVQTANAVTIP